MANTTPKAPTKRGSALPGVAVISAALLALTISSIANTAAAQSTATLTLDGASFISFQDVRTFSLPSGSTLEFQFGAPNADGSIPFTIAPSGTAISPIDIPGSAGSLLYALASPASGVVSAPGDDGASFNSRPA